MKLLFDQNLSPKLVKVLEPVFPDSNHVHLLELDEKNDQDIWEYAKERGYTIVSKDSDFNDLSALKGYPPKVIWIQRGNCKTSDIETLLKVHILEIKTLEKDDNSGVLILL